MFSIATKSDYINYQGRSLTLKGLNLVTINYEKRTITYDVFFDTVLQGNFVEDEARKGAIVYDSVILNKPCTLNITGIGNIGAVFVSYVYNTRKNKYQCSIVQSFPMNYEPNEAKNENNTIFDDNIFNILDLNES